MPHNDTAPVPAPDHVELRLRQQELAARFGLFALGQDELQPVLDEACRVAAQGLGVHHAKLLRCDPEKGDLLVVAGVGWRPGVVGTCRLGAGRESHPFQGVAARALASTRAVETWARATAPSTYPLGLVTLGPRLLVAT